MRFESNRVVETQDSKFLFLSINNISYIRIWSPSCGGKIFKLWMPLKNSLVLMDDDQRLWNYHVLLKRPLFKKNLLSLPCQPYCWDLHRPHMSCIECRRRRILGRKVKNPVEIELFFAPLYKDAKISFLRFVVVRFLRSLLELASGLSV